MAEPFRPFVDNPYIPGVKLWPFEEPVPLHVLGEDGSLLPFDAVRALNAMKRDLAERPFSRAAGPMLVERFFKDCDSLLADLLPEQAQRLREQLGWTNRHTIGSKED